MRKTELIHIHALLYIASEEFTESGWATADDFTAYRELDVSPLSLRASRQEHEVAVRALARTLAEADPEAEHRENTEPNAAR